MVAFKGRRFGKLGKKKKNVVVVPCFLHRDGNIDWFMHIPMFPSSWRSESRIHRIFFVRRDMLYTVGATRHRPWSSSTILLMNMVCCSTHLDTHIILSHLSTVRTPSKGPEHRKGRRTRVCILTTVVSATCMRASGRVERTIDFSNFASDTHRLVYGASIRGAPSIRSRCHCCALAEASLRPADVLPSTISPTGGKTPLRSGQQRLALDTQRHAATPPNAKFKHNRCLGCCNWRENQTRRDN